MGKKPNKTEPQAADIQAALKSTIKELRDMDVYSEDILKRAIEKYKALYPIPPEKHLRYTEEKELRILADAEIQRIEGELSDSDPDIRLGAYGMYLDILMDELMGTGQKTFGGSYWELLAELSFLAHAEEREDFLKQARQKYGWSYEPDLHRPTKISYRPDLSPKKGGLDFSVEAISLYAQYSRAFMGGARAQSIDSIPADILKKAKIQLKNRLNKKQPGADITDLSISFSLTTDKLIEADRKRQQREIQQLEQRLKQEKKEKKELEKQLQRKTLPIRMSRQMIDTTLDIEEIQPDLWADQIKQEILKTSAETTLYKGLPLSGREWKIIYIFYKFLNERNGYDNDPDTVFLGDQPSEKPSGGIAPGLILTNYQIAKEYYGKNPSGKSIENIKSILDSFKDRKFCFTYTAESKSTEYTIQEYATLFTYGVASQKDKATGKQESSEYIRLHPLFRSGIIDKFVLTPANILELLEEAYGKKKVSAEVFNLLGHVTRTLSSKRYTIAIGKDKLLKMVSPDKMKKSRKKAAEESTLKAIETLQEIGYIKSAEEKPAKNGKLTYYIGITDPFKEQKAKELRE